MARKSTGLGNSEHHDLKQLEKKVTGQRKKLGLPSARFPRPDSDIEKKFLKHPNQCPFCDSTDLDAGDIDGGANDTTMQVTCSSCAASWVECYVLVGGMNFEPGGTKEEEDEDV